MKKMNYVSLTLLLSTSLLFPITTLADSTVTGESIVEGITSNTDQSDELKKFTNMQDKITSVLKIENGKYLYNENEVKSIINQFNFEELAQKTGIEYTKESFYEEAIENINETTFKPQIEGRNANRYNKNYYEQGWNYRRDWMDTNNTKNFISEYRKIANNYGLIAALGTNVSKVPSIQWVIGAGLAYDIWYFTNVADNTEKKNNGTGVVFELNLFTGYYNVWSQNEYKK